MNRRDTTTRQGKRRSAAGGLLRIPSFRRGGPAALVALLLAAAAWFLDYGQGREVPQKADDRQGVAAQAGEAAADGKARRVDFSVFRDGQWVTGVGTVRQVLPDDTLPPRHQRFILEDEFGNTVLVAHNIDQAERIHGLKAGDEIAFRGEYRTNDRGGVVHWTHPDSSGRRSGGWLRRR